MKKYFIFYVFLFTSFCSFGQFDITIRGGGLVDMYKVEDSNNDNVFTTWSRNMTKGKPWDFPYLNLELAYHIDKKNIVGIRYHFEEFMEQYCMNVSNEGIGCSQVNDADILKISSHYKRKIYLLRKFSIEPSVGLGVSFGYDVGYLDKDSKLVGIGKGLEGDIECTDFEYMDHKIIPFIPIEINFNFSFNRFLNLELNLGYDQYLRKSIIRTEAFYKLNGVEHKATIYTADNMYFGLGIGYHFNFKHRNK